MARYNTKRRKKRNLNEINGRQVTDAYKRGATNGGMPTQPIPMTQNRPAPTQNPVVPGMTDGAQNGEDSVDTTVRKTLQAQTMLRAQQQQMAQQQAQFQARQQAQAAMQPQQPQTQNQPQGSPLVGRMANPALSRKAVYRNNAAYDSDYQSVRSLFEQARKSGYDGGLLRAARNNLAYYDRESAQAKSRGIDLTQTKYGNIDTNNRARVEWTRQSIRDNRRAIKSWGFKIKPGNYSTVEGMSTNAGGVMGRKYEIAFSPFLQTGHGKAKLLDKNTVYGYLDTLMQGAGGKKATKAKVLALDKKGLKINGVKVRNLVADFGKTARKTGESMHYTGKDGSLNDALVHARRALTEGGK